MVNGVFKVSHSQVNQKSRTGLTLRPGANKTTMRIDRYIEQNYSRWREIAIALTRRYNMSGWGEDALHDVLAQILRERFIEQKGAEEVSDWLTDNYIRKAIKNWVFNRFQKYQYTDIEKHLLWLTEDDSYSEEPAEIWNVRRIAEAKFRDDSIIEPIPDNVRLPQFTPAGCCLGQAKAYIPGRGNTMPAVRIEYVVEIYGRGRRKTKSFSDRGRASAYMLAVKKQIAERNQGA